MSRPPERAAPPVDLPWLRDLNDAQRSAVMHGDGPLLIVAGAGTGKTRTLAGRVARLIATGTDPERILLLTFTRRAAAEMLERAGAAIRRGPETTGRVWGGTFHAIANRLLRIHGRAAGIDPDFTVIDPGDAADLVDVVRHDLGLSARERRFPRKATCLAIYSHCVNTDAPLADVLKTTFPWCAGWAEDLKRLFAAYVERKQARNVLDFDDLLLYWREMAADPGLAERLGGRFDHVLVDEYQDTNVVQAEILRGMRRTHRNITVVGDDAQSIYRFRGADVRNMLRFAEQFPGAVTITLERNYRSVQPVLDAANRVLAGASEGFAKTLRAVRPGGARPDLVTCRDEPAQSRWVSETILRHYEEGIPLRRMAVLMRAADHSDHLEIELTRRNLPYRKYGGLRFLEAAHVKDLVALLRIAENPRDEVAWFRVLQMLDGVGPSTAAAAVAHVAAAGHDATSLRAFPSPPAAREGLASLAVLMTDLVALDAAAPASHVERIRRFYDPLCDARYDNGEIRRKDIENLERIAAGYATRRDFLSDLILDPPASTGDLAGPPGKDEDWLVLSTIHSAKGCEWDVVFILHAADGCLPTDMSCGSPEEIDEERRLLYVAMTRARDFLHVCFPQRYTQRGGPPRDWHTYAPLSRFLTPEVRAVMNPVTPPPAPGETPPDTPPPGPPPDIKGRLRKRWE
jgi:DNA helicase-2/ATP-dependent DNA helicase PcrA